MWEDLYIRGYEGNWKVKAQEPCPVSHAEYKSALAALYRSILMYLVASYCYRTQNSAFHRGLNMFRREDLSALLDEIREEERGFCAVSTVWREMKYDEELEANKRR